jgi:hypothetical protein
MSRPAAIWLLALTLVPGETMLSSFVHAQTIGAAATIDIKRVSGEAVDPGRERDDRAVLDTTSPGLTVFVSAPASAHVSFALEVGFEGDATVTTLSEANLVRLQTRYSNRMRTVSALAAVHPATSRRMRLSVLGGLTFVQFERTIVLDPAATILGSSVLPTRSTFIDRMGAATVGLDCDILVSAHVAIVPAIRAHTFRLSSDLGGFSIRPSIGAKWIF